MDLRSRCIGELSNGAIAALQESGQLVCTGSRSDVWMWKEFPRRQLSIEATELAPYPAQIALQAVLESINDRALFAAVKAALIRLSGDVASMADAGETLASERLADICKRLGPEDYAIAIDMVIHKRALTHFKFANDQAPATTISRLRQVLVDLTFAYGLMPASALKQLD